VNDDASERFRRALVDAGPGAATERLSVARVRIETAEWHLRQAVALGERLAARRTSFDEIAAGNDVEAIAACRQVIDHPGLDVAMTTVERAREALAELAKWTERGDG
jgi:hypothetical protein